MEEFKIGSATALTRKSNITIVISFQAGTEDILGICLNSIKRHTVMPHKILVITRDKELEDLYNLVKGYDNIRIMELDIGEAPESGSKVHGKMLDMAIPSEIDTPYFITLDSDCFPVADGWLDYLFSLKKDCVGILHPWEPPPDSLDKSTIEYRVRYQHSFNMTHVACQMLSVDLFNELYVPFNGGDDTGLMIPNKVLSKGLKIGGLKISRCPYPLAELDPEFNRYMGLVFGDMIYHHGGWTRVSVFGDSPVWEQNYGWVKDRIIEEDGAEWILEDGYEFQFDKEEEVAKEKMDRLFGLRSQLMKG